MRISSSIVVLFALFASVFGLYCGSSDYAFKGSPHSNPNGIMGSNTTTDGDVDLDLENNNQTENEYEAAPAGELSGTIIVLTTEAQYNPMVYLFDAATGLEGAATTSRPLTNGTVQGIYTAFEFKFSNLSAGSYLVSGWLDLNQNSTEDLHEYTVFPGAIGVSDLGGFNIGEFYVNTSNPNYGSISGTIATKAGYDNLVYQVRVYTESPTSNSTIFAVDYAGDIDPLTHTLTYAVHNLDNGIYYPQVVAKICPNSTNDSDQIIKTLSDSNNNLQIARSGMKDWENIDFSFTDSDLECGGTTTDGDEDDTQ